MRGASFSSERKHHPTEATWFYIYSPLQLGIITAQVCLEQSAPSAIETGFMQCVLSVFMVSATQMWLSLHQWIVTSGMSEQESS